MTHPHAGTREGLKAAQREAARTATLAATAAGIAARALLDVDREADTISRLDGLAGRVIRWGADRVRQGASATAPLPRELATARETLRAAHERASDARGVYDLLSSEATAAAAQAAAARHALGAAADAVVVEDALSLVEAVRRADAEAGRLRAVVSALGATWSGASAPLPWGVQALGHDVAHGALLDMAPRGTVQAASTAWTSYKIALIEDANALAPE